MLLQQKLVTRAFPLRQPSNIEGQFNMAISEELPWKHSWFEPFRFLLAACWACWRLTPALVNLEQVSDSRPVPSNASVHLCMLEGWGVSSILTPSNPLAWIFTLPTPLTVSCPVSCTLSNLPLPPTDPVIWQSTTRHVSLSASKEGYVLCYLSLSVPFCIFFPPNCRLTLHYSCLL